MQSINTEQIVFNAFLETRTYSFNTNILSHRQRESTGDGKSVKPEEKHNSINAFEVSHSVCVFLEFFSTTHNWYLFNVEKGFPWCYDINRWCGLYVIFIPNNIFGKNGGQFQLILPQSFYNFWN